MPSFNNNTLAVIDFKRPIKSTTNSNTPTSTTANTNNIMTTATTRQLLIDDDFVVNTYATMDGLLAQYEAILSYERKKLLKNRQTQQTQSATAWRQIPSGFLETDTRFWEFKIESENTTYVRYGNIREDGSLKERATQIQRHPCPTDAKKFVEKLIDEKINTGYVGWTQW